MILIADGGSTKCDWVCLDNEGKELFKTRSPGLNPSVVKEDELHSRIQSNKDLQAVFDQVQMLDFYGAGCGTESPRLILQGILQTLFTEAVVSVEEDMLAAAFAVTHEPGMVCILGTGSNCCYFDGEKAHVKVASLGYIVMDEASGNYFGKRLLRDYFYRKMPRAIALEFEKRYNLNPDHIKMQLYKMPNPNTYLASFAEFLFTAETHSDYYHSMLEKGMREFVDLRLLSYQEANSLPIHFVGSIAYFSRAIIEKCLAENGLRAGNFVQRPIDGLVEYYRKFRLKG
ncbi:MAG: N-acetylglucosamine kinase [Saprospirales bacterium]|nr:MAG: N-acetylglucosamine kinase [Saprospirales bacterium]